MDELYNNKKLKPFLTKYTKKDWKDVILQLSLIGLNQVGNQKVYSIFRQSIYRLFTVVSLFVMYN